MEKWMFSTNKSRVKMEELRKLRRNDFRFLSRALYKRASSPQGVCREKHASMCRLASPRTPLFPLEKKLQKTTALKLYIKRRTAIVCCLTTNFYLPPTLF
jgi:hypothetical protein